MCVRTTITSSAKKAIACLEALGRCGGKIQTRPADTRGLVVWKRVQSAYLRIFFSTKDSHATRVKFCSAVVNFLKLKQHWYVIFFLNFIFF